MKKLLNIVFVFLVCQLEAQEFNYIEFTQFEESMRVPIICNLIDDKPYQQYAPNVFYGEDKNKKKIHLFDLQGDVGSGLEVGTPKIFFGDAAEYFGFIVEHYLQFDLITRALYDDETLAWLKVKDKNTCESYTTYLRRYPQGDLNFEAKAKKNELYKDTFISYTETATGVAFDMVAIKGGTFIMGSPKRERKRERDEVQHRATVSDFYIGKCEVTQTEYEVIMGENQSFFKGDNLPVEGVSWYDAVEFCNKLSEKADLQPYYKIDKNKEDVNNKNIYDFDCWTVTVNKGANGYRLPTEAEWEYAARAGTSTPFAFGDNITTEQVNYEGNYPYKHNKKGKFREETMPVNSFEPNKWGLYNMHGNVYEWCWDWYGSYDPDINNNPMGSISGSRRVFRGGSWGYGAEFCRSAHRDGESPNDYTNLFGLRLSRNK